MMIVDKVAEIIARAVHCNVEDISPETKLLELGVDSLKTISLMFELEEAFEIEIPNEAITSIVTVSDILEKLKLSGIRA